jgi:hypothetical protein
MLLVKNREGLGGPPPWSPEAASEGRQTGPPGAPRPLGLPNLEFRAERMLQR